MFTKKINVAITGLSRSGKTVFLSSLADNLEKNTDWKEALGYKTAQITEGQSFNHNKNISDIKSGKWPNGTSKLSKLEIELYDINSQS